MRKERTHLPEADDNGVLVEVVFFAGGDLDGVDAQRGFDVGGVDGDLGAPTEGERWSGHE
jgi:hypothetical protein